MVLSMIRVRFAQTVIGCCTLFTASSCSLGDLVNNQTLPTSIQDPKVVKTPAGAMGMYYNAVIAFRQSIAKDEGSVVGSAGLLSDELQSALSRRLGFDFPSSREDNIDARVDAGPLINTYGYLQRVRARAHEAIAALRMYHPTAPLALTGHLLAIEGMAEVLLAELYCSGIPLSTLDFEGGYTLQPGSSTMAVFQHALQLFDSALVVTADSVGFTNFASLGRARALLGLQDVAAAALAVASVPTTYRYTVPMEGEDRNLFRTTMGEGWSMSVSDREGGVGIPWVTSGDPRSSSDSFSMYDLWFPRKYLDPGTTNLEANPGKVAVVFASGIEARLIEAEAALLADNPNWLTMLNALRTSCTADASCSVPAPAGTGGIANLPLLQDPALDPIPSGSTVRDVRLDLLFTERAYWLFLTGRRQADLRRLVQQYGREANRVYPSGLWGRSQFSYYGSRISLLVPEAERTNNPLYHGCEDL